jgi:DNA mismatch endonuclease, patch repair protein
MKAIRSTGNKTTEQALARLLRQHGLSGWRRHTALPGRPDFVWNGDQVAVFVDGCFWHGCPNCYRAPRTNSRFWAAKVLANRKRDRRVADQLRRRGFSVLRIWECKVTEPRSIGRIRKALGRA